MESQPNDERPTRLPVVPSAAVPPVQAGEGGSTVDDGGVVTVPVFVADVVVVEETGAGVAVALHAAAVVPFASALPHATS